jgi:hypothetical protein
MLGGTHGTGGPTSLLTGRRARRPDLLYDRCTTGIGPGDLEKLPLTSEYAYTGERRLNLMVQRAIQRTLATWQQRLGRMPRLGVIHDGARAIPRLIGASTTI